MRFIDLHLHTTASDGSFSSSEVCQMALDANLAAIAITDHDTVSGVPEAVSYTQGKDINLIPGIEMSAIYKGVEIHILGFYMDYQNQELIDHLARIKDIRMQRNENMCKLFQKDGINMTMERLCQGNPDTVITRAHFANILVEDGFCANTNQAFKKYLHKKSKYYIPIPDVPAHEAVQIIRKYGKGAFIAHPLLYGFGYAQIEEMIDELIPFGLSGLEVYHSSCSSYDSGKLREIARKKNLLISGGSDFHGIAKPDIKVGIGRGGLKITEKVYDDIKKHLV